MAVEENLNKSMYKLLILMLKYIPKNSIWRYIGYTPQEDNDEVDAYLITYIYDKITSVFYKHDRAAR